MKPSPSEHGLDIRGTTIVEALQHQAVHSAGRPAMRTNRDGEWDVITWAEYGEAVHEVTAGLAALGIDRHDQVGILSTNRAEWHLADHGILANGSVTVPLYLTSSPAQAAYVLGHSEARLCFVENDEQLAKITMVRDELPKLDRVVIFDSDNGDADDPFVLDFERLRALGRDRLDRDPALFERRAAQVQPEDLATLVYTSGTTGPPKGVMLTHTNVMWTLRTAATPFDIRPGERLLSFLPLSHIAERMMSNFLPVAIGGETWFARSLATVAEDLKACRPTVFFAVPRVWEKLHEAVAAKLAEERGATRRLLDLYLSLGLRKVAREQSGHRPAIVAGPLWQALDRAVGARIRHELGLDRAHILVSAAAPVHPDLLRWFHAIGLPVIELYGQTEDCGPTTANRPWDNRLGTVGPAIPGVRVRIASDGEILVQGPNVCRGYFRDEAGTAELIDADGWMHSGDVGRIDPDGFLRITGRKKDIIINSAGKNITPQEIELDLRSHPLVSQAVVVGDGRKYLTALLTLDADELVGWADERGKLPQLEALSQDPDLVAEIEAWVDDVNLRRSRVEGVKKFRILPHDLTIADGELTPTLKVKRHVVNEKYSALIDQMYAESEQAQ